MGRLLRLLTNGFATPQLSVDHVVSAIPVFQVLPCSSLSILLGDIVGSACAINLNVMRCTEPYRLRLYSAISLNINHEINIGVLL